MSATASSSATSTTANVNGGDIPALVGHLTGEFAALREAIRKGAEVLQKALALKDAMEALTTLSALKFSLPRLLPRAGPATLGVGFMVSANGVMMGTRIVVSAEWVEMMRQLVRAGVLSVPAVTAAVRIQAGQVMQAHHQAIHGGGDWKLGRTWPGEWNRMIMKVLREAEVEAGRMLTRNEVLDIVAGRMERYYIPMDFIPWIGP